MRKILLLLAITFCVQTNAQIITTVAGQANCNCALGDGGQATAAKLSSPDGVALDSLGNLYISDDGDFRLRKVNTLGIITTISGNGINGHSGDGGLATAAELYFPGPIKINAGNIYIATAANIRVIEATGIIKNMAGTGAYNYNGDGGPATSASLHTPSDITFDKGGNCYIADTWNNVIRKINTAGIISTIAGNGYTIFQNGQSEGAFSGDGGQATDAELNHPLF